MSDWCSEKLVFCSNGDCRFCPYENFEKAIDISKSICYNDCGESQKYFLEGSYEKKIDNEVEVQR